MPFRRLLPFRSTLALIAFSSISFASTTPPAEPKYYAYIHAARYAFENREFDLAKRLLSKVIASSKKHINEAHELRGKICTETKDSQCAEEAYRKSGNNLEVARTFVRAGEPQRAKDVLLAELGRVHAPSTERPRPDAIDRATHLYTWLAQAESMLGNHEEARRIAIERLARASYLEHGSEILLSKVIVASFRDPRQIEKTAEETNARYLKEYVRMKEAVEKKNVLAVAQYLSEKEDSIAWKDEVVRWAQPLRTPLIDIQLQSIAAKAEWKPAPLTLYNSEGLMREFNDPRFVPLILESRELERQFSDEYKRWLDVLRPFQREIGISVLKLLRGSDEQKAHGLYLVHYYQLFQRDLLNAVAELADSSTYAPVQAGSMLVLWEVLGGNPRCVKGDQPRAAQAKSMAETWKRMAEKSPSQDVFPNLLKGKTAPLQHALTCETAVGIGFAVTELLKLGSPQVRRHPSDPNRCFSPQVFFKHPRQGIEILLENKNYEGLRQISGIQPGLSKGTTADKFWANWWRTARAYYDF